MDVMRHDALVSQISAAIAEPARTRMLYCLMDGHARTSTELGVIAEVSPSTASAHLARLKEQRLVKVLTQGKYRYYSLAGESVAAALEALAVVAGGTSDKFVPNTPASLRNSRTCYDHMAGALAVSLHRHFLDQAWLTSSPSDEPAYEVTPAGSRAFTALGLDVEAASKSRRRFAYACLDWSERQPHLAGALGAAFLEAMLRRRWFIRDLDSRVLRITRSGKRELQARFGLTQIES